MATNAQIPLKTARIIFLTLTWAFALTGGAVGINAIVKRNQQVAYVQNAVAPAGIIVHVDTRSLVDPGILLATGCALTGILTSKYLGLIFWDMSRKTTLSTRTLTLQWTSLAFMSIWLVACAIPVTLIARTGSATVTAFLGGVQLPADQVLAESHSLGVDPHYWTNEFVRIQVIPPWGALGFGILATIVSFAASRKASKIARHPHSSVFGSAGADSSVEKHGIAEREHV